MKSYVHRLVTTSFRLRNKLSLPGRRVAISGFSSVCNKSESKGLQVPQPTGKHLHFVFLFLVAAVGPFRLVAPIMLLTDMVSRCRLAAPGARSCLSARTQPLTATGAPSQTSTMPCHAIPWWASSVANGRWVWQNACGHVVTLSLSEWGPGRFGRQQSFTDIHHTIPYHTIPCGQFHLAFYRSIYVRWVGVQFSSIQVQVSSFKGSGAKTNPYIHPGRQQHRTFRPTTFSLCLCHRFFANPPHYVNSVQSQEPLAWRYGVVWYGRSLWERS